jgi:pimeloyl-ACP methyl ester carboxylesterase
MTASASSVIPEHIEHRITTSDGRTLAVAEWGDPHGVPVFFIHGDPGGRIYWPLDLTLDTRHGIRRLTFDRPGWGESTRLPGRTIADVVPDVVTIADALAIDRFAVAGGSGGGPHALACAALLPDRVLRCLCAVSPAPYDADGLDWFAGMTEGNVTAARAALEGEAADRAICERIATTVLERISAGQVDVLPDDYEVPASDLEQMKRYQAQLAASLTHALAPGVDGWVDDDLASMRPWGFDVAAIRVPVWLQYGRDDTLVPRAHGDWLASRIPHARVDVQDAGHMDDSLLEEERAWLAGKSA